MFVGGDCPYFPRRWPALNCVKVAIARCARPQKVWSGPYRRTNLEPTFDAAAFSGSVDLASEALGGVTLLCSDDFFAPMDNLLKAGRGVFIEGKYTERGKWMDGWEPRRRRSPGHDWCIIQLGAAGKIHGVDIDTNHFTGNHPPYASMDAVYMPDARPEQLRDEAEWVRVLEQVPLKRGSQNLFGVTENTSFTHVRLNIYPAGGVARLRVYGQPSITEGSQTRMDLACLRHGARALACSDMFFSPMNNLLLPDTAKDMGEGWETRRSRPPGDDWLILQLATLGSIERIDIDTRHFKGNYPDRCAIDAVCWPGATPHALTRFDDWVELVPETPLSAHKTHELSVAQSGPWTHLRLRIYPDGGVSRLRAWGQHAASAAAPEWVSRWDDSDADDFFRCCGSTRWARAMSRLGPFVSKAHLFGCAEEQWWHLGDGDWLEAFTHHPRIGSSVAALKEKFADTASWSAEEQAQVQSAPDGVIEALAAENAAYLERFGFIFIVCASGLSAEEMLHKLRQRMNNAPEAELRIAAGEQMKITRLRLQK